MPEIEFQSQDIDWTQFQAGISLKPLTRRKTFRKRGIMTFDIETPDGLKGMSVFCWGLAYNKHIPCQAGEKSDVIEVLQGFNFDLKAMLEKAQAANLSDRNYARIVYSHNFNFEFRFLEQYCFENAIEIDAPLDSSGNILSVYIPQYNIRFVDSFQFLLSSQERAEIDFQIPEKYRKIDCKAIFEKDFGEWTDEDKQKVAEHNKNDVIALLLIMRQFRWENHQLSGVDSCNASSLANLGLATFRRMMSVEIKNPFVEHTQATKGERWKLQYNKERDDFVRRSYHGGRTECFSLGYWKDVTVLDVVSLYPDVMRNCPMPANWGEEITDRQKLKDLIFEKNEKEGFIECRVIPPKGMKYPLLCGVIGDKLLFPVFAFTSVFTLPELQCAATNGYKIFPRKGIIFDREFNYFKKFVDTLFEIKKKSTGGKRQVAKIMLNAVYGKFGQAFERKKPVFSTFRTEEDALADVEAGERKGEKVLMATQGGNLFITTRMEESTYIKPHQNVAIASYITAHARIKLWRMIIACERAGIPVLNCDTDSVFIPSFHAWKIDIGKNLGKWDVEHEFSELIIFSPKAYCFIEKGEINIKLKGIERAKLNQIARESENLLEVAEKLQKPVELAERYLKYREAHRKGLIMGTKKLVKRYSHKNQKRKYFKDGTSIPWSRLSFIEAQESNFGNMVAFVMDSYKQAKSQIPN